MLQFGHIGHLQAHQMGIRSSKVSFGNHFYKESIILTHRNFSLLILFLLTIVEDIVVEALLN